MGVAAEVPPLALGDLADDPSVTLVQGVHPLTKSIDNLDDSIKDTKVDRVHAGTGVPMDLALTGGGVVVGIIDRLGDFTHQDFRNADGTTRISHFWDQTISPVAGESSPPEFGTGVDYTASDINEDLSGASPGKIRNTPPSRHGTNVSAFATSTGNAPGNYVGLAPDADLIWVNRSAAVPPSANSVVNAVDYVFQRAEADGKPAVVNISSGLFNLGP